MSSDSSPIISLATAEFSDLRSYLLNLLVDYAYKEGDFVLSSGQPSYYYINGKQVTLMAQGALATGRLLLSLLPPGTQGVAGLTLGADPLVTAVSVVSAYENCPIPALIIRKAAKGHGTQAYIEGPTLEPGTAIVVLEDVVTTGKSAMLAVERLRAVGYRVQTIIALVDREQGGAAFYQAQELDFIPLFSIREIQGTYAQKMSS
ncbi:orotate phosphoribosyltransferase [Crocosphaera sp. XPORK-15E]|uniref:orotate phosphoribosyltransferase n=1 Tax=Crocosphaera sp. XPORK-15E TaxID=3110247 RepID=UPI002B1FABD4|nr:orotate phosphoribosyltransferase [Crocosphaera sp. XPORK-15E]MEA5534513.1 orotate phosphoribosyltransferase [Crocosphaera sp. XPORK-15E]